MREAKTKTKTTYKACLMLINILSKDNGVGLTQDYQLVKGICEELGHEVFFTDVYEGVYKRSDLNIFLELVDHKQLSTAPKNILIPNAEWFHTGWIKSLPYFDLILAKTVDCMKVFQKYSSNIVYTCFTSFDRYNPDIERKKEFIHLAGRSSHKNTQAVYDAWNTGKFLKPLHFMKYENNSGFNKGAKNINYYFNRVPDNQLNALLNSCQFHVCPSEYEGFGHYLNEARSTGAIIISTDAPPMNEMVTNAYGVLCPSIKQYKHNLGLCNKVNHLDVQKAAEYLQGLTAEQIKQMSQASREAYLDDDWFFRTTFKQVISGL